MASMMGMANLGSKIKHAWNAFLNQNGPLAYPNIGASYAFNPNRTRMRYSNERSIISSIYTRLGVDVAAVAIQHARIDEDDRYIGKIKSDLNECLTVEANIDQAARAFRQDIAMTLFDRGVAALVPVDTSLNPSISGSYDIQTMRVGDIVQWYPRHVRVNVYNETTGMREELTLEKKFVAIVENPLYSVMNEPNSTLQRLIRKLNMLDAIDEQSSSGKLDLIIQLPYVIKSEARRNQADQRRRDIENQLKGSQYGIAYTDGTEKITQLNRPAENNLLAQIEYLTKMLYAQLGLTEEVMNGTADEAAMLNYKQRTLEPILDAIVEAMRRTFLTKTGRSQGQSILYFMDQFKLVPMSQIADIADKLCRNEVASANEIRQAIGWKPSKDPKADQLINSNMPQLADAAAPADSSSSDDTVVQSGLDSLSSSIDDIFKELGIDENSIA
jgi:Phage portal protein